MRTDFISSGVTAIVLETNLCATEGVGMGEAPWVIKVLNISLTRHGYSFRSGIWAKFNSNVDSKSGM